MTDNHVANIFMDDRLVSYSNFFSDDWAQRIAKLTDPSPGLSQIALDLVLDWRGAAYTVSFPAQMLHHFRSFAEGYVNDPEPNTSLLRLTDGVLVGLSRDIAEVSADPGLQRRIREWLVTTGPVAATEAVGGAHPTCYETTIRPAR